MPTAGSVNEPGGGGPLLVGGIGLPWLRDVDFAKVFVERVEGLEWPENVLVEDLSLPAHRVLDRLVEVAPSQVVLVVSRRSEIDAPGTVRRSVLDLTPPPDDEVHQRLVESVTIGVVDVEHTLAVVRYWKGFPEGTVVIEVESGDVLSLDLGDEVEDVVEKVLVAVQEEVARQPSAATR